MMGLSCTGASDTWLMLVQFVGLRIGGLSLNELGAVGLSPLDCAEMEYEQLGLEGKVTSDKQESIEFLAYERYGLGEHGMLKGSPHVK